MSKPINMRDDRELIEDLSNWYPAARARFQEAYRKLILDGDAPAHEQHEPIETRQLRRQRQRQQEKQNLGQSVRHADIISKSDENAS